MSDSPFELDPNEVARFWSLVDRVDRILLAAHGNPDGDAIGSLLGARALLSAQGKECVTYCPDGIPAILSFLPGASLVTAELPAVPCELTILLDTPERVLFADGFEPQGDFVVIDHHSRFDEFGDLVIRHPASSVGEMLYHLAQAAGRRVERDAAVCLYTSIVSDTSSFRYRSADWSAHTAAAALIEHGAEPAVVSQHLFESVSLAHQRLLAEVLSTLETAAGGRYARIYCTRETAASVGASPEDLSGMVNFARGVLGVELAALLREESDGRISCQPALQRKRRCVSNCRTVRRRRSYQCRGRPSSGPHVGSPGRFRAVRPELPSIAWQFVSRRCLSASFETQDFS